MKSALAVFVMLAPIVGAAYAQTTQGNRITGIEVSTDPARAAEVERRAQEIATSQQQTAPGTSGTSGTSETPGTSATSGTDMGTDPKPTGSDRAPTPKMQK